MKKFKMSKEARQKISDFKKEWWRNKKNKSVIRETVGPSCSSEDSFHSILDEAKDLVSNTRKKQYGDYNNNAFSAADIMHKLTGVQLTPKQMTWAMISMKLAREASAHKRDNLVDICGYIELLSEVQ